VLHKGNEVKIDYS